MPSLLWRTLAASISTGASLLGHTTIALADTQYHPEEKKDYHLNTFANEVPQINDLFLLSVSFVVRHGARTPLSAIPGYGFPCTDQQVFECAGSSIPLKIPDSKRTFRKQYIESRSGVMKPRLAGSCRRGQLTAQGRADLREVGTYLREKYVSKLSFLPENFDANLLYVRSTDVERTIESVSSLLDALFPNSFTEDIHINVLHADDENMYPRSQCRHLRHMKSAMWKQFKVRRAHERNELEQELQTYMAPANNITIKIRHFEGLHNTLQCYSKNRVSLPFRLPEPVLERVHVEAVCEMDAKYNSMEVLRLGIGRFVDDLLTELVESVTATSCVRLRLYSGHDNSIGPLWKALMTDPSSSVVAQQNEFPRFASHITLELYATKQHDKTARNNDNFSELWVRVLYNGKSLPMPGSYRNADGDFLVPYTALRKRLAPLIPTASEFKRECSIASSSSSH